MSVLGGFSISATPTDGCLGVVGGVELNNASPSRTAVWFVLDLSPLNFTDGGEEFD